MEREGRRPFDPSLLNPRPPFRRSGWVSPWCTPEPTPEGHARQDEQVLWIIIFHEERTRKKVHVIQLGERLTRVCIQIGRGDGNGIKTSPNSGCARRPN